MWNVGDIDLCKFCNNPISPKVIIKNREKERINKENNKPLDSVDLYLKKLKQHPNIIVRTMFFIVYSVWVIFMVVISIIVYCVALIPG